MTLRPVTLWCAADGCRERAYYEVHTVKEDRELRAKVWYCLRHTRPESVLSPHNQFRATALLCVERPHGRFWMRSDGYVGSGFEHGPGFKAWAKDFEPGTRLEVTATICAPVSGEVER